MLMPELFQQSDLKAVKLQMIRLKPQPGVQIPGNVLTGLSIRRYESFTECPSWQMVKAGEPEESFWKRWGVHILFKQELDGSIIIGDSHEYFSVAKDEQVSFDLHQEVTEYFLSEGRKIFDLNRWEIDSQWVGVYCQTVAPSGVFYKKVDQCIHVVTGIGGKGMTASAGYTKRVIEELFPNPSSN